MQFKVPQFIDIEDKIFGPLTFREFVYLVGGGALCYVLYRVLPLIAAVILIVPVAGLSLALAFYRVNGKPFIFTLEASIKYLFQKKLYIWRKDSPQGKHDGGEKETEKLPEEPFNPRLSRSKLKDIAWSLDILDAEKREGKKS